MLANLHVCIEMYVARNQCKCHYDLAFLLDKAQTESYTIADTMRHDFVLAIYYVWWKFSPHGFLHSGYLSCPNVSGTWAGGRIMHDKLYQGASCFSYFSFNCAFWRSDYCVCSPRCCKLTFMYSCARAHKTLRDVSTYAANWLVSHCAWNTRRMFVSYGWAHMSRLFRKARRDTSYVSLDPMRHVSWPDTRVLQVILLSAKFWIGSTCSHTSFPCMAHGAYILW